MKKRLKIYNVRRKSSLHEKGETMEEKLAVLYNKMASAIISLIPVEWEEIYYLSVEKDNLGKNGLSDTEMSKLEAAMFPTE